MITQEAKTITLFHQFCKQGNLEALKLLQETYALTTADARSNNNLALRWAAEYGHLDICQWLLRCIASFAYTREESGAAKRDAKKELSAWIKEETKEAPPAPNSYLIALLKAVLEKMETRG